ncbi:AAA ATPase central domain protein [Cellulomonas fimi ATCC 484]|uniref:AAA ATPase central domain protein n=2 Tax=Cellulomonas fimi TaxID=1708 RepID=F4H5K4_CELFA|nr:AAA ATPase central domain protein [Cellulomonas fimi ATCC 484]VEH26134.1 ATP-dependent zinc metalloprotease FtsH [Cellulomonas fimi]
MTAMTTDAEVRSDPSTAHLLGRLAAVEERVRVLVARRRSDDPQPDDPFRGLYLSDEAVDRLLAGPGVQPLSEAVTARTRDVEAAADAAEAAGARLRLRWLARTFALEPLDVELLLVALACEVDTRFEQLFGYLNDDVTRRRPSAGVALALCGVPLASAAGRARLEHGPLVEGGLLVVEDADRPLPSRPLRVPDRVVGHLLGDDSPDPAVLGVLADVPDVAWGDPARVVTALTSGARLVYLRESPTGSGRVLAVRALRAAGRAAVVADGPAVAASADPETAAGLVAREAMLVDGGVVLGDVEALTERRPALRRLLASRAPVLVVGATTWDPAWSEWPPVVVDVPASTVAERTDLWTRSLGADLDTTATTAPFRLRPEQVARAAQAARQQATLDGALTEEHVRVGARGENGTALERLARRVDPAVGWDDLVLPTPVLTSLHEIATRARFREQVLGDWRMRPGGGRGHGVGALFAGDSGTGKTMSAEVVAHELGLDLYVVDLATVVDKYIGETEKNLERIFAGAAGVNAVLLFDEADAVFGRRSEVKDAHDRYANIESAYLLQRMETFDGLVVLATNLRANIDEAFIRRLDVVVDFPLPDAGQRLALWDRCLGRRVPRADDVDLAFCADTFELAGGAIRSAAVTAAYLAAADGGTVAMRHVVTAVHREYRKLGRLTLESEFGRYWDLLV